MQLRRRFLVKTDEGDKWITIENYKKDMDVIDTKLHFIPKEGYIFRANESDEEKEYLVFKEDDERQWHEKLKEDYEFKE